MLPQRSLAAPSTTPCALLCSGKAAITLVRKMGDVDAGFRVLGQFCRNFATLRGEDY